MCCQLLGTPLGLGIIGGRGVLGPPVTGIVAFDVGVVLLPGAGGQLGSSVKEARSLATRGKSRDQRISGYGTRYCRSSSVP